MIDKTTRFIFEAMAVQAIKDYVDAVNKKDKETMSEIETDLRDGILYDYFALKGINVEELIRKTRRYAKAL